MSVLFALFIATAPAGASPTPYFDSYEADRARQYRRVSNEAGVIRILDRLRSTRVRVKPFDAVDLGNRDNGYAWHIDDGFLYLFPYRTNAQSRQAKRRFASASVYGESPANQLYRCGKVIAITVVKHGQANRALRQLCGAGIRPGEIRNER